MNKIILLIVLMFFFGCINSIRPVKIISTKQQKSFEKNYQIDGLFDFVPELAKKNTFGITGFPPPDSINCHYVNQNSYVIIISNKSDYSEDLKKVFDKGVIYTTNYYIDSNFIIDITELKRTLFPVAKCNTYHKGKYPIPYFENYDFGLGVKEILKKQFDGEPRPRRHTVYNIPEDLKVYVIGARAGNFWKFDCKENRLETLGKWKHGYSKGVAVSDKYDRVVFWVIVW
ncbi:MAG: hypothetical protein DRJ09_09295 [Bacteroidetes bacterium]|nr:MAG: hypothetical protein DRJ09_09295 [Bacteroidota bacterium]